MADYGEPLFVGWVRTNWTHWEPVTLPPRPRQEARDLLEAHISLDLTDGEKVLLPRYMHPDGRRSQKG